MKYIIASIEGPRFDLAPEYKGKFGTVYKYGSFSLSHDIIPKMIAVIASIIVVLFIYLKSKV